MFQPFKPFQRFKPISEEERTQTSDLTMVGARFIAPGLIHHEGHEEHEGKTKGKFSDFVLFVPSW